MAVVATGDDVGLAFVLAPVQTVEKLCQVYDVLLHTIDDDELVDLVDEKKLCFIGYLNACCKPAKNLLLVD